jgi:hypothetical protein
MMDTTRKPSFLRRYHTSVTEAVLKVIIALGFFGLLFLLTPRGARTGVLIAVVLVLFGLIIIDRAIRGTYAGRSFWQALVLFSEPIDPHRWTAVGTEDAEALIDRFGVRDVERVEGCVDCDALRITARDADGHEFLAYSGEYSAYGMRVGLFVRIARFIPSGALRASEPVSAHPQD